MKPTLIVMMLHGCECEAVQCRYLETVSSNWASVEACEADIDRQIVMIKASYSIREGRCVSKTWYLVPVLTSQTSSSALPQERLPQRRSFRSRTVITALRKMPARSRRSARRALDPPFL